MNLLHLASDIQEAILHLPRVKTLAEFSRALGKPANWLLDLLHENGFHQ